MFCLWCCLVSVLLLLAKPLHPAGCSAWLVAVELGTELWESQVQNCLAGCKVRLQQSTYTHSSVILDHMGFSSAPVMPVYEKTKIVTGYKQFWLTTITYNWAWEAQRSALMGVPVNSPGLCGLPQTSFLCWLNSWKMLQCLIHRNGDAAPI